MGIFNILYSLFALTQAADLKGIAGPNLILKPLEGKTGEARVLIFIIGSGCTQESYAAHMKAI
jgi:hypothetical protein